MMKFGSLGAYTCCDNIRPCLSISPPPTKEPDTGASEEEDVSPAPTLLALGRHSKVSKDVPKGPKCQLQQQSQGSWADQQEMINDFFSGRTREEQNLVKFQQQSQLTSLAHKLKSAQMKD